jgi:hypothetical protein
MTHGENPPFTEREIAILRGWAAEKHSHAHSAKNASADRAIRDSYSDDMKEIEEISRKLGELL